MGQSDPTERWLLFATEELGALYAALISTRNGPHLVMTDEIRAEIDRRVAEQGAPPINWGDNA